jgi:drug/metabolite transporter (DMT)-like permease
VRSRRTRATIRPMRAPRSPTLALTALALTGFAANSVLCRLALATGAIDAATFTAIRLGSGAVALALLATARARPAAGRPPSGAGWASALALFGYAAAFSLAYRLVSAGAGALILFGCVQATMIGWGLLRGERLRPRQWLGVAVAVAGLVALAAPGAQAPPLPGALLMATAGVAWGIYSIRGRGVADPLAATAGNFARTLPFAAAMLALAPALGALHAAPAGIALAVGSGALASGVAYAIWYTALRGLGATQAAVVQLGVPALAAAGGAVLIGEPVGWRLLGPGMAILAGIALALRR